VLKEELIAHTLTGTNMRCHSAHDICPDGICCGFCEYVVIVNADFFCKHPNNKEISGSHSDNRTLLYEDEQLIVYAGCCSSCGSYRIKLWRILNGSR